MSSPEAAIEAVLAESGPDYDAFSFTELSGGTRADVYFVTLEYAGAAHEVVVKFAPESVSTFAVEPTLHEFVAERTNVPVPGILVFRTESERDVAPYFVTERIRGQNLDERFEQLSLSKRGHIMEQVGELMADLHSTIAFEGYGRLDRRDDRLVVRDLTWDWQEYFADMARGHVERLGGTSFEDFQPMAGQRLEDRLDVIPSDGVPRIVHDDFRPGNLLFADGDPPEITAVLDWEQTLAGDPLYNLAQVEFLFIDAVFRDSDVCDQLRERLYAGYGTDGAFEPPVSYRAYKPVYQFSTLIWRMAGFERLYETDSLARSRAEAYYRRQFEALAQQLEPGE